MNRIVDPNGNLQAVADLLDPGDSLSITDGVYPKGIVFKQSGTAEKPIIIEGIGKVTFEGSLQPSLPLAVDCIKDRTDLNEIKLDIGPKLGYIAQAAFNTNGQGHIRFLNFTSNHMKAVVDITPGSIDILCDGVYTDSNRFCVVINGASDIRVINAVARNCWNSFRAFGVCKNLLYEKIETSGSKDVWSGMGATYLNGDGFTFEADVDGLILRDIKTYDHWDAGADIKATHVLIERYEAWGNKNNLKPWGKNIVGHEVNLHHARSQSLIPSKLGLEGHGITLQHGSPDVVLIDSRIIENEGEDVRLYGGNLTLNNCVYGTSKVDAGAVLEKDAETQTPVPPVVPPVKPPAPPKVDPRTEIKRLKKLLKAAEKRLKKETKRLRDLKRKKK